MNAALIKEVAKLHYGGDEVKARAHIQGNKAILQAIQNVLKDKMERVEIPTKVDYDCPSWAFKQADAIGEKRSLREVVALLEVR